MYVHIKIMSTKKIKSKNVRSKNGFVITRMRCKQKKYDKNKNDVWHKIRHITTGNTSWWYVPLLEGCVDKTSKVLYCGSSGGIIHGARVPSSSPYPPPFPSFAVNYSVVIIS